MTEIIDKDTIQICRTWYSDDISYMCVQHNWYNNGDKSEYKNMLEMVHDNEPTYENIFCIADNIRTHTSKENLETTLIMFYIERDVVTTYFAYNK